VPGRSTLLDHSWKWGDENGADLLVVDKGSFAGQMARTRAQGAGVRCAVFTDEAASADSDLILRRPLLGANVVEVLNAATAAQLRPADIGANTADFYTRHVGDETPAAATASGDAGAVASGLDELLRREPHELRGDDRAGRPSDDAPPAPAVQLAAPALTLDPAPRRDPNAGADKKYSSRASMLADTWPHLLRAWLDDDLLRSPSRFALPNAAPLVLDPKNRVAHCAGGLRAIEPYCRVQWRACDWQPLTSADLAGVREAQPAQSYSRLTWLYLLLHSNGRLAGHLDPGGTYRLKQWLGVEKEFGKHFRVGAAMLRPARLHEIAATSEASMTDVFDLVNAYDGIGLIEWTPRQRRDDDKPSSFFGKLRKPFG
jgi:hypothetical protein